MIKLRELREEDVARIRQWPPYPGDMAQMDYALRDDGWLSELRCKPGAFCYAGEQGGDLVAFTILSPVRAADAEFRIALRADVTGLGLGKKVTFLTLHEGFKQLRMDRIHLIVRKNNLRAIRVYQRLGFVTRGECRKDIQGSPVDFWLMEIGREEYNRLALLQTAARDNPSS